jgi:hypothetical protein
MLSSYTKLNHTKTYIHPMNPKYEVKQSKKGKVFLLWKSPSNQLDWPLFTLYDAKSSYIVLEHVTQETVRQYLKMN